MPFTALVLGAYGHVGRHVMASLSRSNCIDKIIASGRNKDKLDAIIPSMVQENDKEKITIKAFDAFDSGRLQEACAGVDLVINCVGPFTNDQGRVAKVVASNHAHYIDIANEQSQYRSMQALNDSAKDNDLAVITGAGTSPGISTMLFMLGASKLHSPAETMNMFYASGRHTTREEAFGSTIGALLETSIGSVALKNGKLVTVPLGKHYISTIMPEPFGSVKMVEFPTTESIIMQKASSFTSIKNVSAYWAMGEVPFGLSAMLKLLKPHKRKWAYNFFTRIVRSTMDAEFKKMQERNIGTTAVLKVSVTGTKRDDTWESTITFPRGGGEAAHYMPSIYAKLLATGRFEKRGLVTPADGVIEPQSLQEHMKEHGWTGIFNESSG
jgi:short subunit dehydrogenase-like uncharacterized protein